MHRPERIMRVAMTMTDGAIQGKSSVDFEKAEALADNRLQNPMRGGVCVFHRTGGVGGHTDKAFPATMIYDRFLRVIRHHFAWGGGKIIWGSLATEFGRLADMLVKRANDRIPLTSAAETAHRPATVERYKLGMNKDLAHAAAFRRVGWTRDLAPLAPQADGARKVAYQSAARQRFFEVFGIVYWAIKARIVETMDNARIAAVANGACPWVVQ